jgi:Zn-dependent protease
LPVLNHLLFLFLEFVRAPLDAMFGNNRRSYTVSIGVEAPKAVTWAVASAHSVRLEGTPPIEIRADPDPNRPGVYSGRLSIGQISLPMAYRVLDERPGEAMSLEIIKAESAPECCPGDGYVCAFAVNGSDEASAITSTYEVTHTRFSSRLMVPFAAVQNIRRLKHNAELRAGVTPAREGAAVKNAFVTGVLTFASFYAMFGVSAAAMLIVLILIHEIGHVVAMKWAGIAVKGIYFVPFFGGVAVGEDRYRSEAERGLVAIMGPAFSLLTTAMFLTLALQGNDHFMRDLALMSAALNGFNLLPLMPLDGGHVAQALLSRFPPFATKVFNIAGLIAGGALALAIGSTLLLVVLLLVAPGLLSEPEPRLRLPALSGQQWALLALAYLATFVFYLDTFLTLSALEMTNGPQGAV